MSASHPLVFRRSARLFTLRLGMLLVVTFGGLALIMHPEYLGAAAITALAGGVATLWYYIARHRTTTIAVDDEAIVLTSPDHEARIRWLDVKDISLGEALLPFRGGTPVRFALIQGLGSQRIAFSDLTFIDHRPVWIGTGQPTIITDIADADVLLAVLANRLDDDRLLTPEEELADESDDPTSAEEPEPRPKRRIGAGMIALAIKLGAKAIKPLLGLFKGTQGVLAVASMGALALLFSWEGAIAAMVMLLFHEYGHVHAMRRSGLPVKGIYFIPFVGAAAVADDSWSTRSQQAYIALSGPLWGALLTLIPFGLFLYFGEESPLIAAVAGMWAMLNLLNLLPISPLDGGKVLSSLGYSVNSKVGLLLTAGALLIGVGLSLYAGLYLFALLAVVGAMEVMAERSAASRGRKLSTGGILQRITAEDLTRLRLLTRPAFPEDSEEGVRAGERAQLRRLLKLARITPMNARQAALWLGVYVAVTGLLLGMLYWIVITFPDLNALRDVFS